MKHLRKIFSFLLVVFLLFCSVSAASGNSVVYVTRTGTKYHRDGCSYLKSRIEMTLEAAVRNGYGRCSRCSPPSLDNSSNIDNGQYTTKYSSSGNSVHTGYTEAEYQAAIKKAEDNANVEIERIEAALAKEVEELQNEHKEALSSRTWLSVWVGLGCLLIGAALGRHKAEKEYEKKEAARKKFEEEKLAHTAKFRGMSCREYAHVPDGVVFGPDLLPIRVGATVPTVYVNDSKTKYHRRTCRYAKSSNAVNMYHLTYCAPCSICNPPPLPGRPQWLKDYQYCLEIKKKYNIPDPDITPAIKPTTALPTGSK